MAATGIRRATLFVTPFRSVSSTRPRTSQRHGSLLEGAVGSSFQFRAEIDVRQVSENTNGVCCSLWKRPEVSSRSTVPGSAGTQFRTILQHHLSHGSSHSR